MIICSFCGTPLAAGTPSCPRCGRACVRALYGNESGALAGVRKEISVKTNTLDNLSKGLIGICGFQALLTTVYLYLLVNAAGSLGPQTRNALANIATVHQLTPWMLVSSVTMAILFFIWIYKTHKLLRLLNPDEATRFTPGWAVAWFLIPIANLFMPVRIIRDLFRKSQPADPGRQFHYGGFVAVIWWIIMQLLNFLANGIDFALKIINRPTVIYPKTLAMMLPVSIVIAALGIVSSLLLLFIVYKINQQLSVKKSEFETESLSFPAEAGFERYAAAACEYHEPLGESDRGRKFIIGFICFLVVAIAGLSYLTLKPAPTTRPAVTAVEDNAKNGSLKNASTLTPASLNKPILRVSLSSSSNEGIQPDVIHLDLGEPGWISGVIRTNYYEFIRENEPLQNATRKFSVAFVTKERNLTIPQFTKNFVEPSLVRGDIRVNVLSSSNSEAFVELVGAKGYSLTRILKGNASMVVISYYTQNQTEEQKRYAMKVLQTAARPQSDNPAQPKGGPGPLPQKPLPVI